MMKYKSHIIWFILAATLFFLGRLSVSQLDIETDNTLTSQIAKQSPTLIQPQNNELFSQSIPCEQPILNSSELVAKFNQIQKSDSQSIDFTTLQIVNYTISSFTEQDLVDATNSLLQQPINEHSFILLAKLLKKLTQFNAQRALNLISDYIEHPEFKMSAVQVVISSWADIDAEAAIHWLKAQPHDNLTPKQQSSYFYLANRVMAALTVKSFDRAMIELENFSDNKQLFNLLLVTISSKLKTREEREYLINHSQKYNRIDITQNLVSSWFSQSPEQVTSWIDNSLLSTEEKNRLRENIYYQWNYSNPEQAAQWFLSYSNDENRQQYANKVARNWATVSPQGALNWAMSGQVSNPQLMVKEVLTTLQYIQPEFVIEQLSLIDDIEVQKAIALSTVQHVYRNDKNKAYALVEKSPFQEELTIKLEQMEKSSK